MASGPAVLYVTQEGGDDVRRSGGARRPQVVLRGFRTPLGSPGTAGPLRLAQGSLWRSARAAGAIVRTCRSGATSRTTSSSSAAACTSAAARPAMSASSGAGSARRCCPSGRTAGCGSSRAGSESVRARRQPGPTASTRRQRARRARRCEPAETIVEVRQGRHFGWPRCWPSSRLKRLRGSCRGSRRQSPTWSRTRRRAEWRSGTGRSMSRSGASTSSERTGES